MRMLSARSVHALRRLFPVCWAVCRRGLTCFQLTSRGLVRVQGPDTETFLQGLLTNDVHHMHMEDRRSLYAHILNVGGRTLYDVILYRLHGSQDEEQNILLECDWSALDSILKLLKVYTIRRKVNLSPCPELSLWAVLPSEPTENVPSTLQNCQDASTFLAPDPRVSAMGWRVVTSKDQNLPAVVPGTQIGNVKEYHTYRYQKGIPEGLQDLPPGVALPLESNLDYMNGISFSKGCYIGQELTARTHHTGVIRKRLMPVHLLQPFPPELSVIPSGAEIATLSGKSAGKYRAGEDANGLALLRLAHIKEQLCVKVLDTSLDLTVSFPEWWPQGVKNELGFPEV
ncbi:putative transferase CAF17, mitochondrial [Ambystoma mexicanum]|uniref:putative transferase CAF17, mitochondrial n=1 Tax=Ambystoma mexicanum TaxID=8296 RepID=UPI0037E97776